MSIDSTPSEIWNNILKGNVEKDDPLWKEYLDKAAVFDERMVDEMNKIVDVLLVYAALFISVVSSFIMETFTQFQRNPADITNDLLVAIYNQLAAQSNNTSIPPVDPRSYFQQSEAVNETAVILNALLYTSLFLSIIVSVIALVAKLWLVTYSRQAFSVGSPYERTMKRQEAYNGVLVWNLAGVINILPVILLLALYSFGFYVYWSILAVQSIIGVTVSFLLNIALMFLGLTSIGGAFVSGCPFRSSISSVIRFIVVKPHNLLKWILGGLLSSEWIRVLWIGAIVLLWAVVSSALAYAAITTRGWFFLFFFTAAIPMALIAQREVVHKPQKYKISHLALWVFLSTLPFMALTMYPLDSDIAIPLMVIEVLEVALAMWMFKNMSKSMANTGEIDAIAWLLKTAPPQYPEAFFKKVGQMISLDSIGCHYRARVLESLMPFLSLLIISHPAPEHPSSDTHSPSSGLNLNEDLRLKNLEIYIACLARSSEFRDSGGTFRCLWEDVMQHPELEQPLVEKLVVLANPRHGFQVDLRSAAIKVLNNYELDMEGNPVRSPATVVWGVATVLRSAFSSVAAQLRTRSTASLMLNISREEEQGHPNCHRPMELATAVESPHSSGEREGREPDIGDSGMC